MKMPSTEGNCWQAIKLIIFVIGVENTQTLGLKHISNVWLKIKHYINVKDSKL